MNIFEITIFLRFHNICFALRYLFVTTAASIFSEYFFAFCYPLDFKNCWVVIFPKKKNKSLDFRLISIGRDRLEESGRRGAGRERIPGAPGAETVTAEGRPARHPVERQTQNRRRQEADPRRLRVG